MKLLKKVGKNIFFQKIIRELIFYYVQFVWKTSRWDWRDENNKPFIWDSSKVVILCFWHGRMLMMFKSWKGDHKLHMLISNHRDGEIIANVNQKFGYGWIKGSTNRGGSQALREIFKVFRKRESVGITPDGPRGPRYKASLGVITIARLAKVDILPLTYSTTNGKIIKSWDRFFIPFPFGRGVFICGNPIKVSASTQSDEEFRQQIEIKLNQLTKTADVICGWDNQAEIPGE